MGNCLDSMDLVDPHLTLLQDTLILISVPRCFSATQQGIMNPTCMHVEFVPKPDGQGPVTWTHNASTSNDYFYVWQCMQHKHIYDHVNHIQLDELEMQLAEAQVVAQLSKPRWSSSCDLYMYMISLIVGWITIITTTFQKGTWSSVYVNQHSL